MRRALASAACGVWMVGLCPASHAQPQPLSQDAIVQALGARYRDGRDIRGHTPHRLVLFTFDDGPRAPHTGRLLEHLDREGVKAVFFVTGARLRREDNAELAREIVRRGHLVANHTMHSRRGFASLSDDEKEREILDARAEIERVIGGRSWLFRPPGGRRTTSIDRIVARLGYTSIGYNQGGASWQMHDARSIADEVVAAFGRHERNQGVRGGIVAMHDTGTAAVAAFPLVVDALRRRNCELLEASDLARGEEELYEIVSNLDLFFEPRDGAEPGTRAAPVQLEARELVERQRRVRLHAETWCAETCALSTTSRVRPDQCPGN